MRVYLELTEDYGDWMRCEVTDMDEDDVAAIQAKMEEIMVGLDYTGIKHFCYHDENGLCTAESL